MNPTWLYVAIVYTAAVALARRAGVELPRRIALFFYLLVLVFFFRPLTQQFVNVQVDVLPSIPPWFHMTRDHHQFTSELNDLPLQIVPWMHQVRESWKSLTPPLWNHFSAAGYPLLGNGQSSAFSLLRFLTLPLSLGHAVSAEGAMKVLIALTFTFLYCRKRYSLIASTVAAVSFAFGGFIVGWLHFPMVTAACLAPAVLYAIDQLAERRTYGRFVFAAVVWAQLLFAGHPETAAHVFWLGGVYVLWLVLVEKQPWRLLLALGGALAVSALLAAPYLGPLLETLPKSKRVAELKEHPFSAAALPNQDRNSAIAMFQPQFFGEVPWEKAWGPGDTEPLAGFPGMFGWVAWIAMTLQVLLRRQWRSRELFYSLATLFVLGVIFSWPGFGESFHLMMPIAAHARARLLFTLLCAIQTAAAIDLARRVPMLLAVLAAAFVLWRLTHEQMYYAYRFDSAILAMFPGMIVLLAAIAVAITRHKLATMLLLVAILAELFHVGRDRNMPLPERMLYPKTPMIAKLQELASHAPPEDPIRFGGFFAQFFPNTSAVFGLEDIRAHDPMSNARYLDFLAVTTDYEPGNYFALLRDPNKPVFDFLNVKYVVVDPGLSVSDPQRYALVYDGRDGRILENRHVLPRFYAARNVFVEFRDDVMASRLRAFRDWSSGAFLDEVKTKDRQLLDDFLKPRPADAPVAVAKIVKATPTDYRLRATAPRWSLVVSSIPWWPGWKVTVDGKRIEPMRVNTAFLGFAIPRGEHDVRVWYAPASFWLGVWISVSTVIGLIVVKWLRRPTVAHGSRLNYGPLLASLLPNEVVAQLGPNSTHTIRMYLKNMSGGTTPVQFRELAVMGTPSSIGGTAGAIATTPVTVSTGTTETQPLDCLLRSQTWDPELDACTSTSSTCYDVNTASCKPVGCGKWTKVLEFTTGSTSGNNYITGEGYLEITGNETWSGDTQINIALEFEYPLSHKTTDAHYVGLNLRQGEKRGIYFYTDGNDLDMSNMTVRLWVRKVSGCGIEGTTASSFTVGKRYFFTKWVPATPACFGHSGS